MLCAQFEQSEHELTSLIDASRLGTRAWNDATLHIWDHKDTQKGAVTCVIGAMACHRVLLNNYGKTEMCLSVVPQFLIALPAIQSVHGKYKHMPIDAQRRKPITRDPPHAGKITNAQHQKKSTDSR